MYYAIDYCYYMLLRERIYPPVWQAGNPFLLFLNLTNIICLRNIRNCLQNSSSEKWQRNSQLAAFYSNSALNFMPFVIFKNSLKGKKENNPNNNPVSSVNIGAKNILTTPEDIPVN